MELTKHIEAPRTHTSSTTPLIDPPNSILHFSFFLSDRAALPPIRARTRGPWRRRHAGQPNATDEVVALVEGADGLEAPMMITRQHVWL